VKIYIFRYKREFCAWNLLIQVELRASSLMVFVFSEENLDFSSICKKIKRTKFCTKYIYIYIYIYSASSKCYTHTHTQGSFNAYFLNFMVRISVKLVTARHKSMELGTTIEKIRDLMHVMMVSKSRWKCNCVPWGNLQIQRLLYSTWCLFLMDSSLQIAWLSTNEVIGNLCD
jgi:hypothetical protein